MVIFYLKSLHVSLHLGSRDNLMKNSAASACNTMLTGVKLCKTWENYNTDLWVGVTCLSFRLDNLIFKLTHQHGLFLKHSMLFMNEWEWETHSSKNLICCKIWYFIISTYCCKIFLLKIRAVIALIYFLMTSHRCKCQIALRLMLKGQAGVGAAQGNMMGDDLGRDHCSELVTAAAAYCSLQCHQLSCSCHPATNHVQCKAWKFNVNLITQLVHSIAAAPVPNIPSLSTFTLTIVLTLITSYCFTIY